MPTSNPEGKHWAYERIARTVAPIIVDVGPGEGTYSDLAHETRPDALWIGVEIFEPYVEKYGLRGKYDEIAIADAREYAFPQRPFVLLAGDVIEHMPYDDAVELLNRAKSAADEIMVSVPIVEFCQGEMGGNAHEAHLYHWGFEEMAAQLPGCETWRGEVVGRFWWKRDLCV
jgi:hypothetical protein